MVIAAFLAGLLVGGGVVGAGLFWLLKWGASVPKNGAMENQLINHTNDQHSRVSVRR